MNRDRKIVAVALVVVAAVLVFFIANYGSQPSCPKPPANVGVIEQPLTEDQMPGSVRFASVSSLEQLVNEAQSSQQGYAAILIYHGYIERLGYTAYYISSGTYDYLGTLTIYVYKC